MDLAILRPTAAVLNPRLVMADVNVPVVLQGLLFAAMMMIKLAAAFVMMTLNHSDLTRWDLPEGAKVRFGRGLVMDMAFSPNGIHLIVATPIGVYWYDLVTMEPTALWENERGMVSTVSLSSDGSQVATSNADGIVKLWHVATQQCTVRIQGWHCGTSDIVFSPDGQYIAASGVQYGSIYVWHTETGSHVASFKVVEPQKGPRASHLPLCFSPDGQLLAYVSAQFVISVRHLATKELVTNIIMTPRQVNALTFSPCGRFLTIAVEKGGIRQCPGIQVWNIRQEVLEMTNMAYDGNSVIPVYSSKGALRVAEVDTDKVVIWDADQSEALDIFENIGRTEVVHFSTDGKQLGIATHREILVWNEKNPSVVGLLHGHTLPTGSVSFLDKGTVLVSRYWGESGVVFWDIDRRQAIWKHPITVGHRGKICALSPCEKLLAFNMGQAGQIIEVWDVPSKTRITTLNKHQRDITVLTFSPIGQILASSDVEGKLYLWDVQYWEKYRVLSVTNRSITGMAFHPNKAKLAIISVDKEASVWDIEKGEQIGVLPLGIRLDSAMYTGDERDIRCHLKRDVSPSWRASIHSITFSPCGDLIAGGLFGEIRFWDATTYEIHKAMRLPEGCQRPYVLVFSPCGRYLASGSWWQETDKVSIRLWEVATGKNITTFWGHPTDIQDLTFSPDGKLLASASFDGTILLWDVKPYLSE
ncbi:MAG: WD40 repeat domain-containing protein [Candidatus Poribacteria bacterium]|nr:WD40 repeat domain-containing protein [Candidatus Poribacteria bacterium]